MTAGEFQG
jgi:hypothetical protein